MIVEPLSIERWPDFENLFGPRGECLEAYPTVSDKEQLPPVSSFMGVPGLFAKAGFKLVAQPSTARQIWRYELS